MTKAEVVALAKQLYRALELTKSDAEHRRFTYGSQSVCVKAIKAYTKAKL
jgi:hypothetical protein